MTTFFLAFGILLAVVVAMSVGVLFANKPIKGSCGGMNALGMETECDVCGGDTAKCDKDTAKKEEKSDQYYEASK